MRITYDKEADAMYLYFQSSKKVARTVELSDLLIADLDKQGKVIGVEVLCASRQIGKGIGRRTIMRPKGKRENIFSTNVPIPIVA